MSTFFEAPQNRMTSFYPKTPGSWRNWLQLNHKIKSSIWLVFHNKSSKRPTITWSEAVDEAICFGWIDSKKVKIDQETFHQYFSVRKPQSVWSKINKEKVEVLTKKGLMASAGIKSVAIAKKNGSWFTYDDAESLTIPSDLQAAFDANPGSKSLFDELSESKRKFMLRWIALAKRQETRQSRVYEASRATKSATPKKNPPVRTVRRKLKTGKVAFETSNEKST